jgi:hypothetical protein
MQRCYLVLRFSRKAAAAPASVVWGKGELSRTYEMPANSICHCTCCGFVRESELHLDLSIVAGVAGYVTQAVFQAVFPAVLLTDMVYWGVLVPFVLPKSSGHTFIDLNMHAGNALLLLTEFALNSLRFPWFRGGYIILWSASYTYFQWTLFTMGLSHKWPYPFMNVETPWAPAWYLFIIVFHGICFALCLLLALGKQSIWSRFNFPTIPRMSF